MVFYTILEAYYPRHIRNKNFGKELCNITDQLRQTQWLWNRFVHLDQSCCTVIDLTRELDD